MNVAELLDIPASMLPEQAILVCQDRSLTYGELLDHVQRTAGALSELGVERGDHVAAIDTNSVELDGSVDEVERKLRRLGSIGRALPDVEVHIVDEDGQSLAPGEIGEVSLRTPHTLRGYYAQDDVTAARS